MNTITRTMALCCAATVAAGALAAAPDDSVQARLARQNFTLGAQVDTLTGYRFDDRIPLDDRRVILPGGDSQYFMVTLASQCFGLSRNRIIVHAKTKNQIVPGDHLVTKKGASNLDVCEVASIHELTPVPPLPESPESSG